MQHLLPAEPEDAGGGFVVEGGGGSDRSYLSSLQTVYCVLFAVV